MSKRVYLETFGCQMNVLDSELVLGKLTTHGYELTRDKDAADVVLFNTCSVREHAEERALSHAGMLQHAKKRRPELIIGIIGCMAQNHQEKLFRKLPHVSLVCGPRHLGALPRLLQEIETSGERRIAVEDFDEEFIDGRDTHVDAARPRPFQAYVKVMEGCDLSCAFCIVPRVRGTEISRPPEVLVEEVQRLADQGVVEITLLGQTVNSYGKGLKPSIDLGGLLRRIHEVAGIRRIRFITSHPSFVRRSLIEAMRDLPKVCKYLHIPAQSGSNDVLKRMRRGYTRERYLEIVAALRENVPGIEIASDWIVGFPGEMERDFEQTISFLEEVRFQNSFVFKYSPRPGTDAAELVDDVSLEEKQRRNQALLKIQEDLSRQKNQRLIGTRQEILVEGPSKNKPQRWTGRTDTYQIVNFEAVRDLRGQFLEVEITSATALSLSGSLV